MLRPISKGAVLCGTAGFLVPFVAVAVDMLFRRLTGWSAAAHDYFSLAVIVTWPTSLWMMATEGFTLGEKNSYFLIATLANALLYAVIGPLLQFLAHSVARLLRSR